MFYFPWLEQHELFEPGYDKAVRAMRQLDLIADRKCVVTAHYPAIPPGRALVLKRHESNYRLVQIPGSPPLSKIDCCLKHINHLILLRLGKSHPQWQTDQTR